VRAGHHKPPWSCSFWLTLTSRAARTQGDGLLMDMYPRFAYRAWPNAVEVAAALLALFLLLLTAGSFSPRLLAVAAAVWLTDVLADVLSLYGCDTLPDLTGAPRVAAAATSNVIKNTVEIGHLWVQLKRGRLDNVCRRFDWFCGTDERAVATERARGLARLGAFAVAAIAMCHCF
jgi:hypothetical protein